ncbi:hypothetical protein [Salinimicrobium soli]|uniref:hypothetical protein n=1 Tax=Salinimicrobium soli TaxID=1254399 RepID=UPI003AAADD61
MQNIDKELLLRQQLVELLEGGFAPNVILLREFDHKKAGIILDGLHFSAWILLGHIHARQQVLYNFMRNPDGYPEVWPEGHWPENYEPKSRQEWETAIESYEKDLNKVIDLVKDPKKPLFKICKNGKTISWAALTLLHHTGYHIGQLKTIGRQLGVW